MRQIWDKFETKNGEKYETIYIWKEPYHGGVKGASVYKIYMLNGHKDPKIFDICKGIKFH